MHEQSITAPGRDAKAAQSIARSLDLWNNRLGRQFGPLSRPQRRALRTLHDLGTGGAQVRVSDLAEELGITSAGATRMLNKLEDLGHIARSREPEGDQREVVVTLTISGIQALEAANEIYFERVGDEIQCLDATEQQSLARLLEKLTGSSLG